MKITCPACGTFVPGGDIDLVGARAVCRPCGEVIALPPAEYALDPLVAELRRPSDLRWSERADADVRAVTLAVTPSRWLALPVIPFVAIWDAMLVLVCGEVLSFHGAPASLLLAVSAFAAFSAFLNWRALIALLNRSRFDIDGRQFALTSAPVPAPGLRLPLATIDGFDAVAGHPRKGGAYSWHLRVLLRDGSAKKLSIPVTTHEHVSFVAARLNAALARVREPRGYRDA